ncbi:MAG: Mini-ribonuclease 3, partial [Lachnospiraceae bacterium]
MAQGITEESMPQQDSLLTQMKKEFQLGEQELNSYSPLVLAYIGDCVYELLIRTLLVGKANCQVSKLHKKAIDYVKAETQAAMIFALMDELTEEEQDVFRRGKNAKPHR